MSIDQINELVATNFGKKSAKWAVWMSDANQKVLELIRKSCKPKEVNKGTGAGGAGTNATGIPFECVTSNYERLMEIGYVRTGKFLTKDSDGIAGRATPVTLFFCPKKSLDSFLYAKFGRQMAYSREPDECYITQQGNHYYVSILEKKNQNCTGTVDEKLKTGAHVRREYQRLLGDIMGVNNVTVRFAFCVSNWLKKNRIEASNPRSVALKADLAEDGILVLFGNDEDYFVTLDAWVASL